MPYTIYKHTFPNNKVYIGATSCVNPEDRWNKGVGYVEHKRMASAIIRYGWDNIKHEIIASGLTKEEAEQIEVRLIAEYQSNKKDFGYNTSAGGNLHSNNESKIYKPTNGEITYANQKVIKIHNRNNKDDWKIVSRELSAQSLKLYLYLSDYENEEVIVLCHINVKYATGIGKTSYHKAVKELTENKYLVEVQGNCYDFYTNPTNQQ